jgi:hypothetical protein
MICRLSHPARYYWRRQYRSTASMAWMVPHPASAKTLTVVS